MESKKEEEFLKKIIAVSISVDATKILLLKEV